MEKERGELSHVGGGASEVADKREKRGDKHRESHYHGERKR